MFTSSDQTSLTPEMSLDDSPIPITDLSEGIRLQFDDSFG